MVAPVVQWIE